MSITLTLDTNVIEPLVTESLRFGDTEVRQPDMVDPVFGTAVWIGPDASVEVPFERLDDIARLARTAFATSRKDTPEALGIRVVLHDPEFVHPAFAGWQRERALTRWAEFAETVAA